MAGVMATDREIECEIEGERERKRANSRFGTHLTNGNATDEIFYCGILLNRSIALCIVNCGEIHIYFEFNQFEHCQCLQEQPQ